MHDSGTHERFVVHCHSRCFERSGLRGGLSSLRECGSSCVARNSRESNGSNWERSTDRVLVGTGVEWRSSDHELPGCGQARTIHLFYVNDLVHDLWSDQRDALCRHCFGDQQRRPGPSSHRGWFVYARSRSVSTNLSKCGSRERRSRGLMEPTGVDRWFNGVVLHSHRESKWGELLLLRFRVGRRFMHRHRIDQRHPLHVHGHSDQQRGNWVAVRVHFSGDATHNPRRTTWNCCRARQRAGISGMECPDK